MERTDSKKGPHGNINMCGDFCGAAAIFGSASTGGQLAKVCTDKCTDGLCIFKILREMDMASEEVWCALFFIFNSKLTNCNNRHEIHTVTDDTSHH